MVDPVLVIGRYALYAELASGGMATIHFGRLIGPVGFSRTVAIKRLHPQFARDPEFVSMFLDEARIAARVRHPNVVSTLDVVATDGELFLVMDYVQGESLARLARNRAVPPRVAASILCGALHGLHAAHEAKDEQGEALDIIHRDVSPHNILVGVDGTARVLDFGVAKAEGRAQNTREGHFKGKISYMAPEQFRGAATRRTDVYAASIVAWEALTGRRLLSGANEGEIMAKALEAKLPDAPSAIVADLPRGFDEVILRGLAANPEERWPTAREMALALEQCAGIASPSEVGEWVATTARAMLSKRAEAMKEIESSSSVLPLSMANIVSQVSGEPQAPASQAPASQAPGSQAPASQAPGSQPTASPVASTLVAPPDAPREAAPRRRPLIAAFLVIPMLVTLLLGIRFMWHKDGAQPASSAPAESAATATATATVAVTAAATATATATVAVTAAVTAASAADTAAVTATAAATATAAPSVDHKVRPPAAPAKAPKTGCDPPYTLDSQGHKHYKVQCL